MTTANDNDSNASKARRLRKKLAAGVTVFDGAMGTEIYRNHIFTNRCFDELNLSYPDLIRKIHASYRNIGAQVLTTNTFGANRLSLEKHALSDKVAQINIAGAQLARQTAETAGEEPLLVAGSVGPFAPVQYERHAPEELSALLAEQIGALIEGGIDFVLFETLPSRRALDVAVDAICSFDGFPFVLSIVPGHESQTEQARNELLTELLAPIAQDKPQPTAFGLNCGLGPLDMLAAAKTAMSLVEVPLILQPNAGVPKEYDGRQIYFCSPEYIATYAEQYAKLGVRGIGGCCGTTPEHIKEIINQVKPWMKTSVLPVLAEQFAAPVVEKPFAERSRWGAKLAAGQWVTAVELTPPGGCDLSETLAKTKRLNDFGVDAVNLPDGPRASCRLTPWAVAAKIHEMGWTIEPILHVCCRDKSFLALQADLLSYAALDIPNLLFITGDSPKLGEYKKSTAVFDLDSVDLCRMQKRFNVGISPLGKSIGRPTSAVVGVGVDPTAPDLAKERDWFLKKLDAGAEFATTQPVFDPDALLRFLDLCGDIPIPIIAGVWPLVSLANATFMQREVPGVNVPDAIMRRMEEASSGSKEDQAALGIEIARKTIERIRGTVQGVQVCAPFGRVEISMAVLKS